MNEQLQLQITDLTTAVEQLRDRPTEHARKQTETPTVTAVQKAAASQGMGTTTTDIKSAFGDMQKEMMQGFQQMQFLAGPPPPQQQQHAWQQPQMGQQQLQAGWAAQQLQAQPPQFTFHRNGGH